MAQVPTRKSGRPAVGSGTILAAAAVVIGVVSATWWSRLAQQQPAIDDRTRRRLKRLEPTPSAAEIKVD